MKKFFTILAVVVVVFAIGATIIVSASGCSDAEMASENLSTAADNFEIERRVVCFNGITDKILLVVEGRSSIFVDAPNRQLEVTVKVGPDQYKKHFLGLSDNVSYFVEQLGAAKTDVYHYRVIIKPEAAIPNFDLNTSL